ncbi:MAG: KTSC domain-containing protein [Bryobacteraceae bacterium]
MKNTPHRVPIDSRILAAAEYNESRHQMQLDFRDGLRYEYFGAPPQTFRDLLGAPSHGSFFNRHIRGRFPYVKIAVEN